MWNILFPISYFRCPLFGSVGLREEVNISGGVRSAVHSFCLLMRPFCILPGSVFLSDSAVKPVNSVVEGRQETAFWMPAKVYRRMFLPGVYPEVPKRLSRKGAVESFLRNRHFLKLRFLLKPVASEPETFLVVGFVPKDINLCLQRVGQARQSCA
jgi:hypothetical protein